MQQAPAGCSKGHDGDRRLHQVYHKCCLRLPALLTWKVPPLVLVLLVLVLLALLVLVRPWLLLPLLLSWMAPLLPCQLPAAASCAPPAHTAAVGRHGSSRWDVSVRAQRSSGMPGVMLPAVTSA